MVVVLKEKKYFISTIKLRIKYQSVFSFNMTSLGMFSLTSVRAFGAKVLAILGTNGNNVLPDMQTYNKALQFSECLSAARLFKS